MLITEIKSRRIGKDIGGRLYVHINYAAQAGVPRRLLTMSRRVLPHDFVPQTVAWQKGTDEIRFDEAPDFDTASEPHPGRQVTVRNGRIVRDRYESKIWHHKWQWVGDDYTGFDIDTAKKWSDIWAARFGETGLNRHNIGDKEIWKQKLKTAGLRMSE